MEPGTTWEEFILEQNPKDQYHEHTPLFPLPLLVSSGEQVGDIVVPENVLWIGAGGPLFEGKTFDDIANQLWVYPTSVIKENTYYCCIK